MGLHTSHSNGTASGAAAHTDSSSRGSCNGSAAAASQNEKSSTSTSGSAPTPNHSTQGGSTGYVGCSIVSPVLKGCLSFTSPTIQPHNLLGPQEGALGSISSEGATNCDSCCHRGLRGGGAEQSEIGAEHVNAQSELGSAAQGHTPGGAHDGGRSGGAAGSGATVAATAPPIDPAKDAVVADALARLLDMQKGRTMHVPYARCTCTVEQEMDHPLQQCPSHLLALLHAPRCSICCRRLVAQQKCGLPSATLRSLLAFCVMA
eukprot:scaffold44098_cov24-Tisochrysis_lutea.AAC.2